MKALAQKRTRIYSIRYFELELIIRHIRFCLTKVPITAAQIESITRYTHGQTEVIVTETCPIVVDRFK